MTTTKIETSPEMREFNRLIEEFDRATGFQFDTETSIGNICRISCFWPSCGLLFPDVILNAAKSIQQ